MADTAVNGTHETTRITTAQVDAAAQAAKPAPATRLTAALAVPVADIENDPLAVLNAQHYVGSGKERVTVVGKLSTVQIALPTVSANTLRATAEAAAAQDADKGVQYTTPKLEIAPGRTKVQGAKCHPALAARIIDPSYTA